VLVQAKTVTVNYVGGHSGRKLWHRPLEEVAGQGDAILPRAAGTTPVSMFHDSLSVPMDMRFAMTMAAAA
jgi:hypothetical protein